MNANDILLRWRELQQQDEQFKSAQAAEAFRAGLASIMQMNQQKAARQQPMQELLAKQQMLQQDPEYQMKMQLLRSIAPQMGGQGGQPGIQPGSLPFASGQPQPSQFARQPIPQYFVKNPFGDSMGDMMGSRTPQDIQAMQYQQDVGRFKAAGQEYATGQGMNRQALASMPPAQRAEWIRNRMTNFPGARGAMQELRPAYGGKQFMQNEQGQYKEEKPQAIVNAQGAVVGYRPKGAVFQPNRKKGFSGGDSDQLVSAPLKQVAAWDPRRILPDFANYNDTTKKVVANLRTKADIEELLRDRTDYEKEGVNVMAIVDYYTK